MKNIIIFVLFWVFINCSCAAQYRVTAPFYIDDHEESVTNLNITLLSSNPSVISSNNLTIIGDGNQKTLAFNVNSNSYGDVNIDIAVCDNGFGSTHTAMFYATPSDIPITNTNLSEFPIYLTVTSYSNRIVLNWDTNDLPNKITNSVNPILFKINRYSTNNTTLDKRFTIGFTKSNNFTDTNVVKGIGYWYTVGWMHDSGSYSRPILCTNLLARIKAVPIVPVQYTPFGFAFIAKKNIQYQILFKSDLTIQSSWVKIVDVVGESEDRLYSFNGPEYQNKIIYIVEIK